MNITNNEAKEVVHSITRIADALTKLANAHNSMAEVNLLRFKMRIASTSPQTLNQPPPPDESDDDQEPVAV